MYSKIPIEMVSSRMLQMIVLRNFLKDTNKYYNRFEINNVTKRTTTLPKLKRNKFEKLRAIQNKEIMASSITCRVRK